jgi:nitrite reductase (NADH) large subunit
MTYTIIGNGVAGNTATLTLSRIAPGERITLYCAERHPYYPRPLLPEFLSGHLSLEKLYFKPASWYAQKNIDLQLGRSVVAIDAEEHILTFDDGGSEPFDRLLLATGGYSWIPPVDGSSTTGVFTLRTVADALAIRDYARNRRKCVVIGGGLLGLEAAAGLQMLGLAVEIVEYQPRLLPRQLDSEGAAVLQKLLETRGLTIRLAAACQEVLGSDRVSGLLLQDGQQLQTDLILVSTGMRPNAELARRTGLRVQRGVVVDDHLRTNLPDIWAAGDVAEHADRLYGIVPAAMSQARIAAASMAGENGASYSGTVPSTTLKITGIDLTCLGLATPDTNALDTVVQVRRADPRAGRYRKLVLHDGKIVGAILLGDKRNVGTVSKLIEQEVDVAAYGETLLEDGFDLKSLLS